MTLPYRILGLKRGTRARMRNRHASPRPGWLARNSQDYRARQPNSAAAVDC